MKKVLLIIIPVFIAFIGVCCYLLFNSSNNKEGINLEIDCNGDVAASTSYKVGDTFTCKLLGEDFKIKIKSVSEDKIVLKANNYGLYPRRENGSISLMDKVDEFELTKGKELVLGLQATDVSSNLKINWK